MSRSWTALMTCSRAGAGSAPGWEKTRMPSRKAISVGIEVIRAAAASSCWSSVSILPKRTSGWSSLAAWNTGPNCLHGPHHSAHQSTSVMPGWVTVSSKVSWVSSIVLMGFYNAAGPPKFRPPGPPGKTRASLRVTVPGDIEGTWDRLRTEGEEAMALPNDDAAKFRDYAHPEKLVSTEWRAGHLDDPGLVVAESDEAVLLYETGHIPGAVKLDWHTELNDPDPRDYVDGQGFDAPNA